MLEALTVVLAGLLAVAVLLVFAGFLVWRPKVDEAPHRWVLTVATGKEMASWTGEAGSKREAARDALIAYDEQGDSGALVALAVVPID